LRERHENVDMMSKYPEQKTLSILLLGSQMTVGGAQRVLLDQALWFNEHGYHVITAFFHDKSNLHSKWQSLYSFPIYNLRAFAPDKNFIWNAFSLIGGLWRCWLLLKHNKINIVETFTPDSNLLGLPVAWLAGVPVRIATHHGKLEKTYLWRQRFHTWLINRGIASVMVAVSGQALQAALETGIQNRRVITIPNGVALPSATNRDKKEIRQALGISIKKNFLISVGRLTTQKAHAVLVQAMTIVVRQYPDVVLCIAGDGPLRRELEEQISSLNLNEYVKLLGERDDVADLLAAADIFVLPSRSEGLPIALLEAMAAGLAVIASRIGGIEEVISDGIGGLLVPVDDYVELAYTISRLVSDPPIRLNLGKSARQVVEKSYTLDQMCEEYLKMMKKYRKHSFESFTN
jgi:glycosyltransferase involved in cell wall biosynthesis